MSQELYQIATSFIPNAGPLTIKRWTAKLGSAEAIFKESSKSLALLMGSSRKSATFNKEEVLDKAKLELEFVAKKKIKPLFYTHPDYPQRLKNCHDSPSLLFYKGTARLNQHKVLGIVGTRNMTSYGAKLVKKLVEDLREMGVLVVSGLAYGVDITTHRECLKNNIETVAVLGHGLNKIYPSLHAQEAARMLQKGGLLTEFTTDSKPDRENFPKRNRIVAGICDAIIVVEAAAKGGALITADLANSYNRDVFAFPGRVNDIYSAGCNLFLKNHRAALIQSAKDLEYILGWPLQASEDKSTQTKMFVQLTDEESEIWSKIGVDGRRVELLSLDMNWPISKTLSVLMQMELKGAVKMKAGQLVTKN